MFKVRAEQLQAMRQLMAEQFMEQMATHLREVFPEETRPWSEERLLKHVTEAAERASQYGVVREGDVQRYLECAVLYGWDFDRAPGCAWARSILEDGSLDGVAKMDAIEEYQAAQLEGPAPAPAPAPESEERHA